MVYVFPFQKVARIAVAKKSVTGSTASVTMSAVTLNERRGIFTPPSTFFGTGAASSRSGTAANDQAKSTAKGQSSSKYHIDMASRKLPPPIAFWSDRERDAYRKNKKEQGRLNRVLGHIDLQEHVSKKALKRNMTVMKAMSAKFYERVNQTSTKCRPTSAVNSTSMPANNASLIKRAKSEMDIRSNRKPKTNKPVNSVQTEVSVAVTLSGNDSDNGGAGYLYPTQTRHQHKNSTPKTLSVPVRRRRHGWINNNVTDTDDAMITLVKNENLPEKVSHRAPSYADDAMITLMKKKMTPGEVGHREKNPIPTINGDVFSEERDSLTPLPNNTTYDIPPANGDACRKNIFSTEMIENSYYPSMINTNQRLSQTLTNGLLLNIPNTEEEHELNTITARMKKKKMFERSARRSSFVDPTQVARELKKEMKELERRRSLQKPKIELNYQCEIKKEKDKFKQYEGKIQDFYIKLKKNKDADEYSEWNIKELETKLFIS